jgi:hypothetical protein
MRLYNFLNGNYTASLQIKSNILALSISYHFVIAFKKRNRDLYFIFTLTSYLAYVLYDFLLTNLVCFTGEINLIIGLTAVF